MKMVLSLGTLAGFGAILGYMTYLTVYIICEWIWPRETIDIAEEFRYREYAADPDKFGNHMFEVGK